ncbi:MAG: hypothetical protein ACTHOG_10930 [Marmoricola sp.]
MSAVVIAFLGLTLAISALTALPKSTVIQQPGPIVVIGMPRLTWDDVSPDGTPAIWSLAQSGAVGALTTRAWSDHSCTTDAWLTLSAGFQAANTDGHYCPIKYAPQFIPQDEGQLARWPNWDSWRTYAEASDPPAHIGMLDDTMTAHGQCIEASGNAAYIGAADGEGVARVFAEGNSTCPVQFYSLPSIDDAAVASLLSVLPTNATIVLAGMGDADGPTSLHVVIVAGPGVRQGMLTSPSTRQAGFLQVADISALILSRLGPAAPTLTLGRVPTVMPTSPSHAIQVASDLTRALNIEQPFVTGFFGLFLGSSAALLAIGVLRWVWIRQRAQLDRTAHVGLRRWFAWIAAMCASMPAATFLVGLFPWWRLSHPRAGLCVGIALICLGMAALALLGPWRRLAAGPMTFVATATFVVIAQDVLHGSRLQLIAVMGLQPVYGGRYFGMGNVGAALWVTSALITAAMFGNYLVRHGHRRLAAATIVLIGLTTLVIDSVPWWGNKAGAMLAITPSFAYLALCAIGLRMTWRRAAAIGAVTVVLALVFTVVNTLVPVRDRTHIGNFGARASRGDFSGLWDIVRLNSHMLTSNWLNGSVLILIVGIVAYFLQPSLIKRPLDAVLVQLPLLGAGISAVMLCWLIAFLAEDSGTGIPPTGLLVLAPLLTLLAARIPATARPVLISELQEPAQ